MDKTEPDFFKDVSEISQNVITRIKSEIEQLNCHLRGKRTDKTDFSVLNGNFWLLPLFFSADKKERLKKFISVIRKTKPDIITLQEVWQFKQLRYLKRSLPEYRFFTSRRGLFFNVSGLVTATRFPGCKSRFTFFSKNRKSSFIEKLAGKGYLTLRIPFGEKGLYLVNTHLYCATNKQEEYYTLKQLDSLKKAAQDWNYLIVGDFNMSKERVIKLLSDEFKADDDDAPTLSKTNKYFKKAANKLFTKMNNGKIDYMLSKMDALIKSDMIKEFLSDHYFMNYRVEFPESTDFDWSVKRVSYPSDLPLGIVASPTPDN